MPTIFDTVNLVTLPPPDVVDTPDFEVIFQEILAQFRTFAPQYDLVLEDDPVAKVMEAWAYRELVLRSRINEAAKANLLAFAGGGDLDQLGADWNVSRLVVQAQDLTTNPITPLIMEDDDSFRYRIQTRAAGFSAGGTVAHYKYWALTADPNVLDAKVYSPDFPNGFNMGGQVNICILSRIGNLVPSDDLLTNVRQVVIGDNVKIVSDLLSVEAAVPVTVDITAGVKLLKNAPRTVFDNLSATLTSLFTSRQSLGFDVTQAWVISSLMQSGVHSVQLATPADDIIVAPNQFPILGTLTLTFNGYADGEPLDVADVELARTMRTIYSTYVAYAIANKRTKDQIVADLAEKPATGILQPTVEGLAQYVGVENTKDETGTFYDKDALAFLAWRIMSQSYN